MLEGEKLEIYNLNQKLFTACRDNKIDVVKKMIEDPTLKHKIDVNHDDDSCLRYACLYNCLEVIKYLFTSPHIDTKPNLLARQWQPLLHIATNGHTELLHFLLFEYKMEIPNKMLKVFNSHLNSHSEVSHMVNMIETRLEKDKLSKIPMVEKSNIKPHTVHKI